MERGKKHIVLFRVRMREIRDWLNSQSYLPEHIDPGYTNNDIRDMPSVARSSLRLRNLNTVAEGHFLKEPYSRHLNEASELRKKKDLLFEERQRRV